MRHPKWEERFIAYLAEVADKPHAYGSHDCMTHAGRVIEAVAGRDVYSEHLGKYTDERSSIRYLKSLGFASPEAMLDSLLRDVPIGFAQRGDLVLLPDGIPAPVVGSEAAMIGVDGGEKDGLVLVPRDAWLKAWVVE